MRLGSTLSKLSPHLEDRIARSRRDKRHQTAIADASRPTRRDAKPELFGPVQLAEAAECYAAGASLRDLAKTYRVAPERISLELRNAGAILRRQKGGTTVLTPDLVEAAVRLYEDGLSLGSVAKRLGVARSTLWTMLRREGVVMRDKHGQAVGVEV